MVEKLQLLINTSMECKMRNIVLAALILLSCQFSWASDSNKSHNTNDKDPVNITYQFAIYLIPTCGKDPATTVKQHAQQYLPSFAIKADVSDARKKPLLDIHIITNVQTEYTPPDEESLHYFGRGIDTDTGKKLQKSKMAIILSFSYPQDYVLSGMSEALSFTNKVAETCKGVIWDETTREAFSPDAWYERRIARWGKDGPRISDHTVIHAYKNNELIRAISLGMQKFNLPDMVVNDFTWTNNNQMANLINIIGQSMLEGSKINKTHQLNVNIHEMRNESLKKEVLSSLKENGTARAMIPLKQTSPEEGDPDNFLLEIDFDPQVGNGLQEKQETFISQFFGSEDKVIYVKHDEEIRAASEEARKKLPKLKQDFNKGLEPGEFIYLKAPFKTPDDSNEWMWIEVIAWNKRIKGILQNEPYHIPTLRAGAEVYVSEADIFDYLRNFPDGTTEGNETSKLIQAFEDRQKTNNQTGRSE